jgi:hypothetical protein
MVVYPAQGTFISKFCAFRKFFSQKFFWEYKEEAHLYAPVNQNLDSPPPPSSRFDAKSKVDVGSSPNRFDSKVKVQLIFNK